MNKNRIHIYFEKHSTNNQFDIDHDLLTAHYRLFLAKHSDTGNLKNVRLEHKQ